MSRIKARNTKPEIRLRRLLFGKGVRGFRIYSNLPGKPDIVFTKKRLVIFVDGCFWHKCPLCFVKPATRKKFWMRKIRSNVKRDKHINKKLKKDGWKTLRFWEHEIRKNPEKVVSRIIRHFQPKLKL